MAKTLDTRRRPVTKRSWLGICGAALAVLLALSGAGDPAPAEAVTVERAVTFVDVAANHKFGHEISWMANNGISTGSKTPQGVKYLPKGDTTREAMAAFLFRMNTPDGQKAPAGFKMPSTSPFADVPKSHKFFKEIAWMHASGLSTGTKQPNGKPMYAPSQSTSREAMAAFMYRLDKAKKPAKPAKSPFVDVATSHKFFKEIAWMQSAGLSTGTRQPSGLPKYNSKDTTSREAMAAFLYRFSSEKTKTKNNNNSTTTVTVAPEVEVLKGGLATGLKTVSGSQSAGANLTFTAQSAQAVQVGDVIAAGITAKTPNGLLVRVREVQRSSATATVVTEPATLTDAIVSTAGPVEVAGVAGAMSFVPEEDVTVDAPVAAGYAAPEPGAEPDAVTAPGEVSQTLFQKTFTWTKKLEAKEQKTPSTFKGSGYVDTKIKTSVGVRGLLRIDMGTFGLKEAAVKITPWAEVDSKLDAHGEFEGEVKASLGKVDVPITFSIGVVPVVVQVKETFAAKVNVAGEADVVAVGKA